MVVSSSRSSSLAPIHPPVWRSGRSLVQILYRYDIRMPGGRIRPPGTQRFSAVTVVSIMIYSHFLDSQRTLTFGDDGSGHEQNSRPWMRALGNSLTAYAT